MNFLHSVSLDALRSFVAFSDTLNFTRAAEALHISQPALHVKIRKLADLLGTPLYRRMGSRLELTEHGRSVAHFGREMEERSVAFVQQMRTGASDQPVILAAGEGAYLYVLGKAIRHFTSHAKTPLRLLTLDRDAALDAVLMAKAHLGVGTLEATPEGFESKVLTEVGQALVVSARHPLAKKKEVSPRDLSGASLIVPPSDRPHRMMLARALQSAGVEWRVAVEANGWELMIRFVELGVGMAIVNASCRIPSGLVARPIPTLPRIRYHVFHLRGMIKDGPRAQLRETLLKYGSSWSERNP